MTEEEIQIEELPIGTDPNELFVSQNTEDIEIVYNGKRWQFTIRELTWKEEGDCETAAINLKVTGSKRNPTQNVQMDPGAYNMAYLQKAIVKSPFPITIKSFLRIGEEFGDLLVAAVIKDGDVDMGESEKL